MKEPKDTKILVVDDEVYMREIVAFDLEKRGYQVTHAESGKVAFDFVKAQPFDLVISDVRMPSGNGIELLKSIRKLNSISPSFIFMTAFADISADEALDQGAEAFLSKPLVREELLNEVKKVLVSRNDRWAQVPLDIETITYPKIKLNYNAGTASKPVVFLGTGGFFLERDSDFPDSLEFVAIDITLEQHAVTRIEGYGQVRWVRHEESDDMPPGIGLEILYLTSESRAQYLEYLKKSAPKAYIPLGYKTKETEKD